MKIERESSFELLRIISMFLIVLCHVITHGNIISNCNSEGLKIIFKVILLATLVHVNSFVMTSGYFQSKSKFKQDKLWSIIGANWFYKIAILILFSILSIKTFTTTEIIYNIFPLNISTYWFITPYLILYCLSPFLNKLIDTLSKKDYQHLLIVLFIIFSIIPYFTADKIFSNNGYTLYNFIFLYFIGAYLRKYPLEKSHIFEKCSTNLFRIIMVIIYITVIMINYSFSETSKFIISSNSIISTFVSGINYMSEAYSNPLIIIQSIAFVALFSTLKVKSNFINRISALTLGVYFIHDNDYVREVIYKFLRIDRPNIESYYFVLYAIVIAILIFITCLIIEYFRQLIFKILSNTKISQRIKENYYKKIKEVYVED